MASQEDLLLLRKTVESVKTLEQVAMAKDFNNFLNAARELSDNVVKLVQMALANNAEGPAGELRENVKQAMGCAKILLRDKTDEALGQFRNYLKEVARVIIAITQIVRSAPGAGSNAPPPVRYSLP
jgi:DNA mismatch repair ATPase MutS